MRRLPLLLEMSFWPRSLRPFVSFCHYDAHPGFGLWFLLKVRCFLYFFVDWEDGADCCKYLLSAAHACIFFCIQRPQIGCVSLFRHFWTSLNFKANKNKIKKRQGHDKNYLTSLLCPYRPGPSRSKAKVVKVLHYWVHQTLNFISTHNDKIETHIARFCTTGAWRNQAPVGAKAR